MGSIYNFTSFSDAQQLNKQLFSREELYYNLFVAYFGNHGFKAESKKSMYFELFPYRLYLFTLNPKSANEK